MSEIEIEAFRADTPASRGITAAHIADAAAAFDPATQRVPVVMGHPGNDQDAPAFGEITGARADGNKLFVKIKNLAQAAVDGVKESRILNRSIAFWHPNHPSNPAPGKFSLRHLGLLGGAAPAIPGMAPLRFAADDQDADGGHIVADGEPGSAVIYSVPEAPAKLPTLDEIADAVAAKLKPATPAAPQQENFTVATEQELADREAALKAREDKIAADEAKFAADAKAARESANTTFAADLVKAGKFPAGLQGKLVAILNSMPTEALTFASDDVASPADGLKAILNAATPVIQFTTTTPSGNPDFAAGDETNEAKALAQANARAAAAWQNK